MKNMPTTSGGYAVFVHPSIESTLRQSIGWDPVTPKYPRQTEIRGQVRRGGHTPGLQAECAVMGHERGFDGVRCHYCLAKLDV
jgi:hypothetical protein